MALPPIPKARISLTKPLVMEGITKLAEVFNRQGGDIVQLSMGLPVSIFCFRKPEHIKQIYAHKVIGTIKPPNLMPKADWLMGNGIYNDPGDDWRRKRAVSAPSFERRSSEALCRRVPEVVARIFGRWDACAEAGRTIDIYYEMQRLVVDLSFEVLFSETLGERLDEICRATHFAEKMFPTQTPFWLPLPSNRRFRQVGKQLNYLMREILVRREEAKEWPADILSALLAAVDPQLNRKWTNQEVISESFSIYFGASAMSSPLTWALYLLSQHPPVLRKLKHEIAAVTGNRPLALADLHQLTYLDMFFNETNRLYPPFWGSLRYAKAPIEIAGYTFPKKTMFIALRYFAQRHPEYWQNPEAFDPERFSQENRADFHPVAFLPYGAGPRTCLGQHMAPIICKFVIAALISRYQFEFRPRFPNDPQVDFSFGVYPKDKIMMLLRKAAPAL
ncbi:MAG: cytochrome P450 [Pseudomonadota bacterium]|nr:cytochrome P450 [Pseudomonadota bacterium]